MNRARKEVYCTLMEPQEAGSASCVCRKFVILICTLLTCSHGCATGVLESDGMSFGGMLL